LYIIYIENTKPSFIIDKGISFVNNNKEEEKFSLNETKRLKIKEAE
jgi:hypothetical protein